MQCNRDQRCYIDPIGHVLHRVRRDDVASAGAAQHAFAAFGKQGMHDDASHIIEAEWRERFENLGESVTGRGDVIDDHRIPVVNPFEVQPADLHLADRPNGACRYTHRYSPTLCGKVRGLLGGTNLAGGT